MFGCRPVPSCVFTPLWAIGLLANHHIKKRTNDAMPDTSWVGVGIPAVFFLSVALLPCDASIIKSEPRYLMIRKIAR